MKEKELEDKIQAFYKGHYNVLVSTTIIESGIDIPNANTMIINNAHMFGLSQLHQLRGRIGRSSKKAYAYFIIPKDFSLSSDATKRLQALKSYAQLGSGFSLASCDLEIRGAGDILGGEQSGHLSSVGLEIYSELLAEAIHELKGDTKIIKSNVEIQMPDPAYLPNDYIQDSAARLKYYKQISNAKSTEDLDNLRSLFNDIFGEIPIQTDNLFTLIASRFQFEKIGARQVQMSRKKVHVKMDKDILENHSTIRDKLIELCMKRPKTYQLNPDYSFNYNSKTPLDVQQLLTYAKEIAQHLVP
jgi:transcription-repair coupling factor (superfamily II helicase)